MTPSPIDPLSAESMEKPDPPRQSGVYCAKCGQIIPEDRDCPCQAPGD